MPCSSQLLSLHAPTGKGSLLKSAGCDCCHLCSPAQERYLSLAPLYYRGAHAAAVVYDITSPESFEKAKYWIGELQKNETSRPGECALRSVLTCAEV